MIYLYACAVLCPDRRKSAILACKLGMEVFHVLCPVRSVAFVRSWHHVHFAYGRPRASAKCVFVAHQDTAFHTTFTHPHDHFSILCLWHSRVRWAERTERTAARAIAVFATRVAIVSVPTGCCCVARNIKRNYISNTSCTREASSSSASSSSVNATTARAELCLYLFASLEQLKYACPPVASALLRSPREFHITNGIVQSSRKVHFLSARGCFICFFLHDWLIAVVVVVVWTLAITLPRSGQALLSHNTLSHKTRSRYLMINHHLFACTYLILRFRSLWASARESFCYVFYMLILRRARMLCWLGSDENLVSSTPKNR